MTPGKALISAVLVGSLIALAIVLVRAPLYATLTAPECLAAYAEARTMTDTFHVDLRRYKPASGPTASHRCSEVRAVRAESLALTR